MLKFRSNFSTVNDRRTSLSCLSTNLENLIVQRYENERTLSNSSNLCGSRMTI